MARHTTQAGPELLSRLNGSGQKALLAAPVMGGGMAASAALLGTSDTLSHSVAARFAGRHTPGNTENTVAHWQPHPTRGVEQAHAECEPSVQHGSVLLVKQDLQQQHSSSSSSSRIRSRQVAL